MRHRTQNSYSVPAKKAAHQNRVAKARTTQRSPVSNKRTRGGEVNLRLPFAPPEDWHEPAEQRSDGYRVVVQPPGPGFRHVVTAAEVRARLDGLPKHFLRDLEVVQLSRMTRKKCSFPCYGMQWGNALYLYPLEEDLVETFYQPPRPSLVNESRMYGGRWRHVAPSTWQLIWNPKTIKDFYLNNILIHELGHLLDDRNTSYVDRERYAEWFAIRYGYQPSRRKSKNQHAQAARRRKRHG